jgi:hypothetical protein
MCKYTKGVVCILLYFLKYFLSFDDTLTSTDISIGVVSCHDIFIHLWPSNHMQGYQIYWPIGQQLLVYVCMYVYFLVIFRDLVGSQLIGRIHFVFHFQWCHYCQETNHWRNKHMHNVSVTWLDNAICNINIHV